MKAKAQPKSQKTHDGNEMPIVKVAAAQTQPHKFSENEWNFDKMRVLDAEVEICCYWEYARESAFIGSVRERSHQIAGCGLDFTVRQKFVGADFGKIRNALGRTANLFQEGIYGLGGTTLYEEAISPFPQPWQLLTPDMRRILLETAAWTPNVVMEIPAFRWSHFACVMALAKHFEAKCLPRKEPVTNQEFLSWIKDPKAWETNESFLWGDKPRTERPSLMSAHGSEMLMVEIEWGRFNNEQIIECFRKWVRVHRPKNVKAPSGQGQKDSDWRAALNRLGIMRALNAYTFADHRFPQPLKERGEKACYAARKEAGKTFRRLFRFLPEQEKPIHWDTKGGKAK